MRYPASLILTFVLAGAASLVEPTHAGRPAAGGGNQARISGIVVTESGETVAGASVTLTGNGESALVRTGRRGTFRFGKLTAGTYTVRAFAFADNPMAPGILLPDLFGTIDVELGAGERANVLVVVRPVG